MAKRTVVGLYDTFEAAHDAATALERDGIPGKDISLLGHRAGTGITEVIEEHIDYTDVKNAAKTDAFRGSLAGGLLGFLVGMGFLAVPGVGPILAAGPILATLGGAGLGGATGGIIGALTHHGVPVKEVHTYAEALRRGGNLVIVHVDDSEISDIAVGEILHRFNPVDITEREVHYRNGGYTGFSETAPALTAAEIEEEMARLRVPGELGNGIPGIQTGGVAEDGSPDTRGILEKIADAITGDHIDDKTGKRV